MGNSQSQKGDIEKGNYTCYICHSPFYEKTIWGQDTFCSYDCKIKYNKIINDYYDNSPANRSPSLLGPPPRPEEYIQRSKRTV